MKMENKINYLKEKHIFVLCILIAVIYLILLKGLKWSLAFVITSNGYMLQLIAECFGIIVSVIIIHLVGKKHIFKEKGKGIINGIFVGGFLIIVCALEVTSTLRNVLCNGKVTQLLPLSQVVVFVVAMITIGISEEFIFRGAILNLFLDKFNKNQNGIYASIIISSIIFGVAHIANIFSGVNITSAFIQAIGAAILGALLSAIYLRTKNIWVVVILHALMDFSSLIGSGFFGVNSLAGEINSYRPVKLIGYLIYLSVIIFLLRKEKMLEILEGKGQMNINSTSL